MLFLDNLMTTSESEIREQQQESAHIFISDLTSCEKESSQANIKPGVNSGLTWSGQISITMCCSCWNGSSSRKNQYFADLLYNHQEETIGLHWESVWWFTKQTLHWTEIQTSQYSLILTNILKTTLLSTHPSADLNYASFISRLSPTLPCRNKLFHCFYSAKATRERGMSTNKYYLTK